MPIYPNSLLFITGSLSGGGAERVLTLLAEEIRKKSIKVYICCLEQQQEDINSKELTDGINYSFLGQKSKFRYFSLIKRLFVLRREIKSINPDIVIGFMLHNAIQAVMSSLGLNIPVILRTANTPEKELSSGMTKILARLFLPKIKGAVFQTEYQQKGYESLLKCKSVIISNPVSYNASRNI